MYEVRTYSHRDLQALRGRSDLIVTIHLVHLEFLSLASDSFALVRNLIELKPRQPHQDLFEQRVWSCPHIVLLSILAGVALELHKIKDDLYPLLVVQEAKLEGGFLEALLLLKNSAVALEYLAKDLKDESLDEEDEEDEDHDDDVLLVLLGIVAKVEEVGKMVQDTADPVLKGTHNIAWLQLRLPSVLELVNDLLSTSVRFPEEPY